MIKVHFLNMNIETFITVFTTVLSGVLVYILGLLFNEYFLKPIQNYKELKSKISFALTFYANLYMNPISESNEEYSKASLELRKLASEIDSFIELCPRGNIFIPNKKRLSKASKNLLGISNNFYSPNPLEATKSNEAYRNSVYSSLRIINSVL